MHFGRIRWYDQGKERGVIEVKEGNISTRYFLLYSKILSAPVQIRAGQYVKFVSWQPAYRPDLLPTAHAVTISETPFEKVAPSVLAALSGGASQKTEVRQ
jgi:hypothetical protein